MWLSNWIIDNVPALFLGSMRFKAHEKCLVPCPVGIFHNGQFGFSFPIWLSNELNIWINNEQAPNPSGGSCLGSQGYPINCHLMPQGVEGYFFWMHNKWFGCNFCQMNWIFEFMMSKPQTTMVGTPFGQHVTQGMLQSFTAQCCRQWGVFFLDA